ncbi:hypothetical protein E2H14_23710 [Salmonella enterica subsp. enterica serovar Muenchen]|nr:hypothetical protein [Salmonella enterica subsp. enterica]EAX6862111.1 hypothetical protein [Salmonella enterica]ECD5989756.1 hypothetical protein [Salmonella enterica subsp. enterica serovar Muenchen]EDA6200995.1 hypothetical protein [Salmonella enterica subsp. enterica serovar Newport]EDR7630795.1 hypothetical protein [Salmonella enterica subsp. enterica]
MGDKVQFLVLVTYRLTPGFGGFTPVPYATTECRLPCRKAASKNPSSLVTSVSSAGFSFIDEIYSLRNFPVLVYFTLSEAIICLM